MKPGMTAATRIVTDERSDVIRVPNQALRYRPGARTGAANRQSDGRPTKQAVGEASQAQLWVLRDGQAVSVRVVVGLDDDSFTEIVRGDVKPGDQVVIGEQSAAADSRSAAPRLRL